MKEKRIGRPSTYAITIKKLRDRGYVYKIKTGQLISFKLGEQVLEAMDMVENGKIAFLDVVSSFYQEIQNIIGKENMIRQEKPEIAY